MTARVSAVALAGRNEVPRGPRRPSDAAAPDTGGRADAVLPRARERTERGSTGPARVLLVDDEPSIRTLLRVIIGRDERFTVVGEVADGLAAIDAAAELRPDVILLDLLMPRMDGRQALPTIREVAPDTMVLVLSSLSAADEAGPARDGGAFAFLEKGVMGPGLPDLLDEHLVRFRGA